MTLSKKWKDRRRARVMQTHLEKLHKETAAAATKSLAEYKNDAPRCSFCGKSQNEVKKLIVRPKVPSVCNECIEIFNEILADDEQYALGDHRPSP